MNRSPIVIAATVAGLALTLGFRPHPTGLTPASTAGLTTGKANVSGAQTVVGSDQALAGGLGDIQVKVTAANGKIVSVGMAKMNLHGPQSQQISNNVIPQLEQQTMASNGGPITVSPAPPTRARPTPPRCRPRWTSSREDPMQRSQQVMGTVVSFSLRAAERATDGAPAPEPATEAALERAEAKLRCVDDVFSTYKPESPVSRLRRGEIELDAAPPEVAEVLELCRRVKDCLLY